MILATDVHYSEQGEALAAGVLFEDWLAAQPSMEMTVPIASVEPYQPGAFYKRELPCLIQLIDALDGAANTIIVDGFVSLGADDKPGLGMHLYRELGGNVAIIGVAKSPFKDTPADWALYRGESKNPLYVSAVGMNLEEAKQCILAMSGKHRLPVLLKRVDQLCRGIV